MKIIASLFMALMLLVSGCGHETTNHISMMEEIWGEADGKLVKLFTLNNENGMVVKLTNYGGTLTYVAVPDKNGLIEPVVLGFDSLKQYQARNPMFGSTVGRYANRIGGASFILDEVEYPLTANRSGITMHGGTRGFNSQVFDIDTTYIEQDSAVVVFTYLSADGEEGFPGNLAFTLTYVLTGDNEIVMDYAATTDKPTVVNFTNHSYFNLSGCRESILDHELMIAADEITPVDSNSIPTGQLLPVEGTAYDFTAARKVGDRIEEVSPGYDMNYKLRKPANGLALAAEVFDPATGRFMQAYTTQPGMQFYSANGDLSNYTGHNGMKYGRHYGICLEMQHFPDSPNKPAFPSTVLRPGEQYKDRTIYKFTVKN